MAAAEGGGASGGVTPSVRGFACEETMSKLLTVLGTAEAESGRISHKKVSIVGVGAVGMACAFAVLTQNLASEIALVDMAEDKLMGEAMDLQHGRAFSKNVRVRASTDYSVTAGSNVVVVTAGVRQRPGETRLGLVSRNLEVFKAIIPQVAKHSPDCCILVVSNPVDIMTWVTWKLSGFPLSRVFGSGTSLDSSRFRTLIADKLAVAPSSVHGLILGEHGDSSVPVWSQLNVAGVRLKDVSPKLGDEDDPENWREVHRQVVSSAYEIILRKGYTNWAIGLTVASLVECVLRNEHRVLPVSTLVKGKYGIDQEVFLSVPAVLGAAGVREIINISLDDSEESKLRTSAAAIFACQEPLDLSLPPSA